MNEFEFALDFINIYIAFSSPINNFRQYLWNFLGEIMGARHSIRF